MSGLHKGGRRKEMNQNGYWLENIKKKMAHRSLIVAAGVDDLNQQQCLDKAV